MGRMQTQITNKVNEMTSQLNTLGNNQQILSRQMNFMAQGVQQMAVNIDKHFEANEREISNIYEVSMIGLHKKTNRLMIPSKRQ